MNCLCLHLPVICHYFNLLENFTAKKTVAKLNSVLQSLQISKKKFHIAPLVTPFNIKLGDRILSEQVLRAEYELIGSSSSLWTILAGNSVYLLISFKYPFRNAMLITYCHATQHLLNACSPFSKYPCSNYDRYVCSKLYVAATICQFAASKRSIWCYSLATHCSYFTAFHLEMYLLPARLPRLRMFFPRNSIIY